MRSGASLASVPSRPRGAGWALPVSSGSRLGPARRGQGGSGWSGRVVQSRARESGGGRARGAGVGGESEAAPRQGQRAWGRAARAAEVPPARLHSCSSLSALLGVPRRRLSCSRWEGGLQAQLLCPPVCQTRGRSGCFARVRHPRGLTDPRVLVLSCVSIIAIAG